MLKLVQSRTLGFVGIVLLLSGALLVAGNSQEPVSTPAKQGPLALPGEKHLRNVRQLTFGGCGSTTVAAGALVISDAVRLDVQPLADLAVTLYLPGEIAPSFQITGRYARQTNYISPPGNFAAAITMPVGKITDEWFFVSGVDVTPKNSSR